VDRGTENNLHAVAREIAEEGTGDGQTGSAFRDTTKQQIDAVSQHLRGKEADGEAFPKEPQNASCLQSQRRRCCLRRLLT
jgi:hypothetical protein